MKKLLLIVNPVSGKMKIRSALSDVLDRFEKAGYDTRVAITQRPGYAAEVLRERSGEVDLVVCCGGDGTLNEVIRGMIQSGRQIPFGYIPAGSTNDFANCLGLSQTPVTAADAIIGGQEKKLDIGKFNDMFFSYIASFGVFSAASYSVPQSTKNTLGHFAYILEGIKDLKKISSIRTVYETNGERREGEYVFGAILNSTSIAGIVKLDAKLVDMNDGEFEVIFVKMPKSLTELNKIVYSISTSDFNNSMFDFFKTAEIKIEFDTDIPWSLDGEYCNGGSCARIRNLNNAITIVR